MELVSETIRNISVVTRLREASWGSCLRAAEDVAEFNENYIFLTLYHKELSHFHKSSYCIADHDSSAGSWIDKTVDLSFSLPAG